MNNDKLVITSDTTPEDVVQFVEDRVRNPTRINDTVIYNLSSYDVREDELREAIDVKLSGDVYVIPHQVTSAHGFIMTILPEQLKEADILVYASNSREYRAYSSLYAEMRGDQRAETQVYLSDIVEEQLGDL